MENWFVEKLPSGQFGVFAANGLRVGVHRTKEDANRHKLRLIKGGRKRGRKSKGDVG